MAGSVTISASFGTRGNAIGPAVATRLGLPFLDRAIPAAAARRLHLSEESVDSLDERAPSRWGRLAAAFAEFSPSFGSPVWTAELLESPEAFRSATEAVLREVADTTGAVILGRAGMVVLGDRPDVLRVRLAGSVEARIAQAVLDGADETKVRQDQKDTDNAREGYLRFFYNVGATDPNLYHLIIDATAFSAQTCVDVIVRAAEAHFAAAKEVS